jgi:hypothetical protein
MRAIEFETEIQNGMIVLPKKYNNFNAKRTRIIVLVADDNDISLMLQKKERLRLAFKKLQEVNPFRNILNPIEWQKQIRDEWERSIIR